MEPRERAEVLAERLASLEAEEEGDPSGPARREDLRHARRERQAIRVAGDLRAHLLGEREAARERVGGVEGGVGPEREEDRADAAADQAVEAHLPAVEHAAEIEPLVDEPLRGVDVRVDDERGAVDGRRIDRSRVAHARVSRCTFSCQPG